MHEERQALELRLRNRLNRFLSCSEFGLSSLPSAVRDVRVAIDGVLARLRMAGLHGYLWGGLVRDFAVRRVLPMPRDIDIVVDGVRNEELAELFRDLPVRRNRFGGVHIEAGCKVDIFALSEAWVFQQGFCTVGIEHLPRTTFFNVEAIIVEIEASRGRARNIFSSGFFEAVSSETIDMNCPLNPYPALCILRAIVMARELDFCIGGKLARYLVNEHCRISEADYNRFQLSHYGVLKYSKQGIDLIIDAIQQQIDMEFGPVILPGSTRAQTSLWPNTYVPDTNRQAEAL